MPSSLYLCHQWLQITSRGGCFVTIGGGQDGLTTGGSYPQVLKEDTFFFDDLIKSCGSHKPIQNIRGKKSVEVCLV